MEISLCMILSNSFPCFMRGKHGTGDTGICEKRIRGKEQVKPFSVMENDGKADASDEAAMRNGYDDLLGHQVPWQPSNGCVRLTREGL